MSEEQRITKVEKEKDPRRVEAGKRLAAISRASKEKKARQRMEQTGTEPKPTEDSCGEGYSMITVLTGVGVLSDLVCLYFTYRQDRRATAKPEQQVTETPSGQTIPQPKQTGNKLRSLDD